MQSPLIMVIEDDLVLSQIFTTALETVGFQVKAIVSGVDARNTLETCNHPPNVIMLDLHLPYVSGIELLEQIRADRKFTDTRIVIITADPILGESVQKEGDHLLFKPASIVQIRNLVTELTQA